MTTAGPNARTEAIRRLRAALSDLGFHRPLSHVDYAVGEFGEMIKVSRKRAEQGKPAATSMEILIDSGNVRGTVHRDLRDGYLLGATSLRPDGSRVEGKELPGELAVRSAQQQLERCLVELTGAWHGAVRASRVTGEKIDVQVTLDAGRVEEIVLRDATTGALIDSTIFRPDGKRVKGEAPDGE